jgi:hypothetical protein
MWTTLLLCVGLQAPASDNTDALVQLGSTLSTLRNDVDSAAADVDSARRAAAADVDALRQRKRALADRLAQSRLVAKELLARSVPIADGAPAAHVAVVREVLTALRLHIDRTPFRAHARRSRVDAIELQLDTATAAEVAAALWPLLTDEATLLRERGRARQSIELSGQPALVEVAHVGPLVFFKTKEGDVGVARLPAQGPAVFTTVSDVESRQRLQLWFEAMRKDDVSGLHWLPNPRGVR